MQSSYSDPVEHNPAHNYITTTHRGDIMSIQSMPSTALYHLSQKWKQLINNFMIIQDISIPATNADITHVSRFLINSFLCVVLQPLGDARRPWRSYVSRWRSLWRWGLCYRWRRASPAGKTTDWKHDRSASSSLSPNMGNVGSGTSNIRLALV